MKIDGWPWIRIPLHLPNLHPQLDREFRSGSVVTLYLHHPTHADARCDAAKRPLQCNLLGLIGQPACYSTALSMPIDLSTVRSVNQRDPPPLPPGFPQSSHPEVRKRNTHPVTARHYPSLHRHRRWPGRKLIHVVSSQSQLVPKTPAGIGTGQKLLSSQKTRHQRRRRFDLHIMVDDAISSKGKADRRLHLCGEVS